MIIANSEDLARAQIALIDFGWFHFAVVDKNGCAWLLCEHEDGEMCATCGSEDGWLPALQVVTLHGPLTVLQDLSKPFGRKAAQLGEPTDKSLPEILGVSDEAFLESMHASLERLRRAERNRQPCGALDGRKSQRCPHCPCTYSTECCYCDGSRTPLEDS